MSDSRSRSRQNRRNRSNAGAILAVLVLAGCIEDRTRPEPFTPELTARLSVQLLAPRHGLTVPLGGEVTVSVSGRDLDGRALTGVGFVARRFGSGSATLDSAAIEFAPRSDSTHVFTFRVPAALPNNVQVDVYGIAYGPGRQSRISVPSNLVAVQCTVSCN